MHIIPTNHTLVTINRLASPGISHHGTFFWLFSLVFLDRLFVLGTYDWYNSAVVKKLISVDGRLVGRW